MVVTNLVEFTRKSHAEQLKFHNLVQASSDLISFTKAIGEMGAKAHENSGARKIGEIIGKIIERDESAWKLIAKLGAIGVAANTINELNEMEDEDTDGKVAVATKNALVIALLFVPGWQAVAVIMAVELAWAFLKDSFVDSSLEAFLKQTLLFNNRRPGEFGDQLGYSLSTLFTLIKGDNAPESYLAPILLGTVHSQTKSLLFKGSETSPEAITGFKSSKEVRQFVADNYDAHPQIFKAANESEISILKSFLYGHSLKLVDNEKRIPLVVDKTAINLLSDNEIEFSAGLQRDMTKLYLTYTKQGKPIYEELPLSAGFDVTTHLIEQGLYSGPATIPDQKKELQNIFRDVAFITVSKESLLKFRLTYEVRQIHNRHARSANNYVAIEKTEPTALAEQDYIYLKKETV